MKKLTIWALLALFIVAGSAFAKPIHEPVFKSIQATDADTTIYDAPEALKSNVAAAADQELDGVTIALGVLVGDSDLLQAALYESICEVMVPTAKHLNVEIWQSDAFAAQGNIWKQLPHDTSSGVFDETHVAVFRSIFVAGLGHATIFDDGSSGNETGILASQNLVGFGFSSTSTPIFRDGHSDTMLTPGTHLKMTAAHAFGSPIRREPEVRHVSPPPAMFIC